MAPKPRTFNPDDTDDTIADLLDAYEELLSGQHPRVVSAMVEKGYTEEEVHKHLEAFGDRIGRTMGWL
jgi:predicted Ser/Thr protein kinase